jgi:hypothetical protein
MLHGDENLPGLRAGMVMELGMTIFPILAHTGISLNEQACQRS